MVKVRVRPETGRIYFDGFYRGKRFKELTLLKDSVANRRAAQALAAKMNSEIEAGTFDFSRFFPSSKKAPEFDKPTNGEVVPIALATGNSTSQVFAAFAVKTPLFAEFANQFYAELGVDWRANTRDWMESLLRTHLVPTFGARLVNSITREDVLAFRFALVEKGKDRPKPLSPKTVNVVMRVFKAIMAEASTRFAIPNPVVGIKRLKVPRKDIQPFSLDEVKLMIERIRKDYQPFLKVAFFTGMRPAEQFGLRWEFIDFERRQILIRETLSKGRTEYTKTDGSQREIQMSAPIYEALKAQYQATGKRGGYVFCLKNGSPLNDRNYSERVWHPLLRHLQLKRRVPYQTRHTAATLWLGAGENPEWIARQLGHTTTEMLFRVYSRYVPNLTRRDGSAFEQLVSSAFHGGIKPSANGTDAGAGT